MTIASALTALNTDIVNARTAITNKGGTVTSGGGSSQLATDIATIPTGGSAPVITSLNVTPTTSAQTITAPSGTDGYSPVNVAAVTASIDNNIVASNIKSGVSILGVSGSVTELKGETRSVSLTSSSGNTFTPSSGKNGITSITVTPNNQARTVTPSTSSQSLTINSGYSGNGTITVNAVTSSIDANITAGNIKKDVSILGVTGTYEGSGGEFQLTRIKDDTNTEIGTYFMDFTDGNGQKYKVVLLDAQYRKNSGIWCTTVSTVTDIPIYNNLKSSNIWNAKETATFNTQKILDFCAAKGYNSPACNHCREQSFLIGGVRYYGQFPNLIQVARMAVLYNQFDALDPTSSSYPYANFSEARVMWSSSQYANNTAWRYLSTGNSTNGTKTTGYWTIPVLEIPY